MGDTDLSPYEVSRLERIKRNNDKLRSLGLLGAPKPAVTPKARVKKIQQKRRAPAAPTRASKRLKELKEGKKAPTVDPALESGSDEEAKAEPEDGVNYKFMPQETDQLDDKEFQVYVALRAWRLRRKNELEVEPYKICQNRTLCELIRRRRNDATFAAGNAKVKMMMELKVERQLLTVWGIGPSKAARGGFGWEMKDVLDSKENEELLEQSRKNSPGKHDATK